MLAVATVLVVVHMEYGPMRKADLRAEKTLLGHPANLALVAGVALIIVCLLVFFTLPALLTAWTNAAAPPKSDEAWPAAPPTYAPPTYAPAALQAPPTPTPLPAPVWQELSYLTTVEFTASTIVEAQRKTSVILLGELVTDRLLLRAVGKVQVGVDLGQVSDVQISGKQIRFRLPEPQIVSVELLPQESEIYIREQSLFLSQYTGLEKEALEQARQQLRAEVESNASMMTMAEQFARLQLAEFLRKAGFAQVEIVFPAREDPL
jgi:hypothetical protein